jgi:prepilin-type N-terminal cleavage/methylation domain-containing protein
MENRRNFLKNQQGFTLVEIIAALVILGILAAVAVPKFIDLQKDAEEKAIQGALAAAASNVTLTYSQFLLQNGKKPTGFSNSTDDANAEWTGGKEPNIQVETDLGDFTASYEKTQEDGDDVIKIVITEGFSEEIAVDDRTKNIKVEFGEATTTS